MTWEMGGRLRREGTYVYLWLIHVDVWQKPSQHCKAIILQLKINKLNAKSPVTLNETQTMAHSQGSGVSEA